MKFVREIKAMALDLGFENVVIEHRRSHPMLRGSIGGRPVQYFFPGTPSDGRAMKNISANLRRLARGVER